MGLVVVVLVYPKVGAVLLLFWISRGHPDFWSCRGWVCRQGVTDAPPRGEQQLPKRQVAKWDGALLIACTQLAIPQGCKINKSTEWVPTSQNAPKASWLSLTDVLFLTTAKGGAFNKFRCIMFIWQDWLLDAIEPPTERTMADYVILHDLHLKPKAWNQFKSVSFNLLLAQL